MVAFAAYSNSFSVPFQFDDQANLDTPIMKDLTYFHDYEKASELRLSHVRSNIFARYFGSLSFALNYHIHGHKVFGYHVVNMAIHLITALLIYALVRMLFQTPFFAGGKGVGLGVGVGERSQEYLALFSALFFVCHPLQTQAVTYIVQRFASMVTLFYIACVLAYLLFRLAKPGFGKVGLFILAIVLNLVAMKTKENAFTLPITLFMVEVMFFSGPFGKRTLYLLPFLVSLAIVPYQVFGGKDTLDVVDGDFQFPGLKMTGTVYMMTSFRVIVTYLRLLFVPVNQNLDYDYPIYDTFFDPNVFLSFILLTGLFLTAGYLFWISSVGNRAYRLVSFGIFWFYITLAVESTIVPLPNVIFEHRMYMPMFGAVLAIMALIVSFYNKSSARKGALPGPLVVFLSLLVLVYSYATYNRNLVWQDPLVFWLDIAKKSPNKARAHTNAGLYYSSGGMYEEAEKELLRAIEIDHADSHALNNLSANYLRMKRYDDAIVYGIKAVDLNNTQVDAHINLAISYAHIGKLDEAINELRVIVKIDPDSAYVMYKFGLNYANQLTVINAIKVFSEMQGKWSSFLDSSVHNDIGLGFIRQGRYEEAEKEFATSLEIDPDRAITVSNIAVLEYERGNLDKAVDLYKRALEMDEKAPVIHNNLGVTYERLGMDDEAVEHYSRAIEIAPGYRDPYYNLSVIYKRGGDEKLALEYLNKYRAFNKGKR